jgi:hypothetical protein
LKILTRLIFNFTIIKMNIIRSFLRLFDSLNIGHIILTIDCFKLFLLFLALKCFYSFQMRNLVFKTLKFLTVHFCYQSYATLLVKKWYLLNLNSCIIYILLLIYKKIRCKLLWRFHLIFFKFDIHYIFDLLIRQIIRSMKL